MNDSAKRILESRRVLAEECPPPPAIKSAEEGGCGVVGMVSTVRIRGRQIYEPSIQMHNRGNGKGGGIATAAFDPKQLGIDAKTLRENYILQIALLDNSAEDEVERECITPFLRVDHKERLNPVADYRDMGLDVRPPDIVRYFVRVKEDNLAAFAKANGLGEISRAVEDEFIYQNSFRLNQKFYASLGEQRAFVLSHARDLMIFKIVGYAEQAAAHGNVVLRQQHVRVPNDIHRARRGQGGGRAHVVLQRLEHHEPDVRNDVVGRKVLEQPGQPVSAQQNPHDGPDAGRRTAAQYFIRAKAHAQVVAASSSSSTAFAFARISGGGSRFALARALALFDPGKDGQGHGQRRIRVAGKGQ